MSKQFEVYLLPVDIENVVAELRQHVGIKIVRAFSPTLNPIEANSAIEKEPLNDQIGERLLVNCYLIPPQRAEIRMRYVEARSQWSLRLESEAVEFSGCEFDGKVLVRGRFYFQNDILVGDTIAPKHQEFLEWADRVFRTTKKLLHRSKELDAYVGPEAETWRRQGGKFASLVVPERGPIYV